MVINYIIFGISICVISWVVGIIVGSSLVNTDWFKRMESLNFIRSKAVNKYLGLNIIKWLVTRTFLKFFNQAIKLNNRDVDLHQVRHEMTVAEINHLIGFAFVIVVAIYKSIAVSILMGLVIMFFNVLMNLYPSLLQQENKRRLDKLILRKKRLAPET